MMGNDGNYGRDGTDGTEAIETIEAIGVIEAIEAIEGKPRGTGVTGPSGAIPSSRHRHGRSRLCRFSFCRASTSSRRCRPAQMG